MYGTITINNSELDDLIIARTDGTPTYNLTVVVDDWDKEELHQVVLGVAADRDLKLGKLAQPIRVAVTGNVVSPPIDATLCLIGRERVLARLDKAINFAESKNGQDAATIS